MSSRFPDRARMRCPRLLIAIACGSAFLLAVPPLANAQEDVGREPAGIWQGTFQLTRDDPRIRTRGGADLLRVEVIHSRGQDSVDVNWVAGRAICEDVTAPPCDWVGASGIGRGRILGGDLVFALPLSADEADPVVVILRHVPRPRNKMAQATGQMMNVRADFSYRFDWARVGE